MDRLKSCGVGIAGVIFSIIHELILPEMLLVQIFVFLYAAVKVIKSCRYLYYLKPSSSCFKKIGETRHYLKDMGKHIWANKDINSFKESLTILKGHYQFIRNKCIRNRYSGYDEYQIIHGITPK